MLFCVQGEVLRIFEGFLVYALGIVFLIMWLSLRQMATAPSQEH